MERNEAVKIPDARGKEPSGCASSGCCGGTGSNKAVVAIWVTILLGGVGGLMYFQKQNAREAERLLNEAQMLYGQRDFSASTERLRRSAELGNAWAQLYYGGSLKNGIGTEPDQAEAVKWLRKSAKQKCPEAYCQLGICYENGEGVDRDLDEAASWYRKALNDPGSAYNARTALERLETMKAKSGEGMD